MVLFEWNDNYLTNVKECDNQHKKLVELINELHDKMKNGVGAEAIETVLAQLLNYTVYHFSTEETLFAKHGYPETKSHKEEHNDCKKQLDDFYEKFTKGDKFISIQVSKFLKNWLNNHMLATDKKYGNFLLTAKDNVTSQ